MYIYIYSFCVSIYIYIERERDVNTHIICVHVCICVCIYIYTYIYIYIYIHIRILRALACWPSPRPSSHPQGDETPQKRGNSSINSGYVRTFATTNRCFLFTSSYFRAIVLNCHNFRIILAIITNVVCIKHD